MADGSIEFNVELDAKDAEAELRRLRKEINKLEDDTKVKQAAKDRLTQQLQALGYAHPQEVFFMCVNTKGLLMAQGKGKTDMQTAQAFAPEEARW